MKSALKFSKSSRNCNWKWWRIWLKVRCKEWTQILRKVRWKWWWMLWLPNRNLRINFLKWPVLKKSNWWVVFNNWNLTKIYNFNKWLKNTWEKPWWKLNKCREAWGKVVIWWGKDSGEQYIRKEKKFLFFTLKTLTYYIFWLYFFILL